MPAEGLNRYRDEPIPVRMLNEYSFCPRLAYMEMVEGEFIDNEHTIEGTRRHDKLDKKKGRIPHQIPEDKEIKPKSITLSSEKLNIISKIDILEISKGKASPVEIKKGKGPDEGAWPADIVQITAQMRILKDNGYDCKEGFIYYSASNKRISIELTEERDDELVRLIEEFRKCIDEKRIPPPLRNSRKCEGCSLAPICLPDEINLISDDESNVVRCMYPKRDDAHPLILQDQGSYLSKKDDVLVVKKRGEKIGEVRTFEVSHVCLFGNSQISTQALSELLNRNIPVLYFSYGGWFKGYTHSMINKNVDLRIKQFEHASDRKKRFLISKELVRGKIKNCRTMLRRNGNGDIKAALEELKRSLSKLERVKDIHSLLGIEGNAGRVYFGSFNKMIKNGYSKVFNFERRNRRPPADPVNACLSLAYTVLSKDLTVSALTVGFDPMLGFYHRPRYGRPALALDIMEEFRPIIADSVVISALNNDVFSKEDFITSNGSCNLVPDGRKKFFGAYERRVSKPVKHPLFGYQVSYRRIFEIQMRLMSRYLTGEIESYIPFTTR